MRRKNTTTYQLERKLFFAGVFSIALLSILYVYFVSAAIAHVVMRKELAQEITKTQMHISDLESEYIMAKDAVGLEYAYARGFEKTQEKVFVRKVSSNMTLSLNNESE